LASSWDLSADGLSLTFHLDGRARWSDQTPVTARDVIFSHKAASSPEVGWVGRDVKEFIASVSAVDDHTVVYKFTRRYPYQLMDAVEGNILPQSRYTAVPFSDWAKTPFTDAPVVSGPYRLASYRQNETIELERNDRYAGEPPAIARAVFRVIPDENTLLAELESGRIDLMENVPPNQVARLAANPALKLTTLHDLSWTYICWNTRSPLFSSADVRRALTMAIDRQAIVEGLLYHLGSVGASPVLSLFWEHDAEMSPLAYDPAEARRLLAAAGWKDTDGDGILDRAGRAFQFTLESNQGSKLRNDVAVLLQAQLRKVGVDARPRVIEWGAFVAGHEKHDFEAFIGQQREATKVDLKSLLHTSAIDGGYNYGSWSSPAMDDLIDKARSESDSVKARDLWVKAQRLFHQEQPLTVLFEKMRVNAASARLENVVMTPRSAIAGLPAWQLRPGRPGAENQNH
ncbi:MAG TPA: ABC transporter substrate-binding protein, partial [Patescibacteria group bacterium]|nr:ABC transporter substrate-binding protein [Patescibacteria group bacterium]